MPNENLLAITPIDGRYKSKTKNLSNYFSEFALIKTRVEVEINWLILISKNKSLNFIPELSSSQQKRVLNIFREFSIQDAKQVKNIEKKTNHDVKAVELFIVEKLKKIKLNKFCEFVHFCCTSEDINNLSYSLMLQRFLSQEFSPAIDALQKKLHVMAKKWAKISMLAFTHGQPASPTTLGKEFSNFSYRLKFHSDLIKSTKQNGKFNGASGNYNAHLIANHKTDWEILSKKFVNSLGLNFSSHSTQIELKDAMAYQLTNTHNLNNVLIDFAQDIWLLISKNYLKQNLKAGEVGSSTMPHKVNPIDFENAEGNLGLANAIFEHLSAKLPISRLQRDLTDSTVLRNIGVPIAHGAIAFSSIEKGLGKLLLNESALQKDLEDNWAVVAEAIQTILRREGVPNPYEMLKDLTRSNEQITADSIASFIDNLAVSAEIKEELRQISPSNYTGI